MPLYEYQCQKCGARTEALQRYDDPPPATCAECGGSLKRLLSAPAFQFKGSGWYLTDYARKGSAREGAAEKEAKEGTAGAATPDAASGAPSEAKKSTAGDKSPAPDSVKAPGAAKTANG